MGARGRAPQLGQMYVADFETCDSDDFYKIDGEGERSIIRGFGWQVIETWKQRR